LGVELAEGNAQNKFFKGSNILVTNYPEIGASEIRAWSNAKYKGQREPFRSSENYHKLSYNSAFPWQANGTNGEVSMNYMFHTKVDSLPYEPAHLYKFKKFEKGVYYRDITSEIVKGTVIHLAEMPIKHGILRVDKFEGKKVNFSLGHYALPNINGTIKETKKTVDGKEIIIIDNGDYKLAMVPVYGWNKIKTIATTGLHPQANKSKTINTTAIYKGGKKTLMLQLSYGKNPIKISPMLNLK